MRKALEFTRWSDLRSGISQIMCHRSRKAANRLGQDVFVSGGSLLVDPQRLTVFPLIYHETGFAFLINLRGNYRHRRRSRAAAGLRSRAQCVQYSKSSGIF